MKYLFFVISVLLSNTALSQTYMFLPIVEVYDGDTIKSSLGKRLPPPLNKISVRINGIDTPEIGWRAKCEREKQLALEAKQLVNWLAEDYKKMTLRNYRWDKYGGRILSDVYIGGIDVAKTLIFAKLAVEYHGKGPKHNWCK